MPLQDKKFFIICDDFGLSRGIDQGIIDLLEKKYSQGTSVLFSKQTDKSFIKRLKSISDNNSKIKIGLHLNFSVEGENIELINIAKYIKLFCSKSYRDRVSNSIEKQIEYFESVFEKKPNHIDSHKHFHQLPVLRNLLITTLKKKDNETIPVRNTFIPLKLIYIHSKVFTFKEKITIFWFNLSGKSFKKRLIKNSINTNSNFLGYYDLKQNINPLEKWKSYLEIMNDKSLFVIHPGHEDCSILKYDPINSQRLNELRTVENINTN